MKRKFVILNNGLRDHRGHYFETSISIAEAARRAGLHPVLATHVDCRTDLLPTWLESYPIFCTDHWMSEPAAAEPDLNGLALDPYATAADAPSLTSRLLRRSGWACRKAAWLAERSVYYLLPPLVYDGIELTSRLAIPRILRPESRARVAGRVRQILHRLRHGGPAEPLATGPCSPETARSLRRPFERPFTSQALQTLRPLNLLGELEHALIFKRDLERLLAISEIGPEDHVLMGTAHARELLAVQLVAKRLGAERAPTFHLEFRHALFQTEAVQQELEHSANVRMQRVFFSLYQSAGPSDRVKFYTDTEELARDYGRLARLPFGVLPIPFRSELISTPRMPAQALRLAYIGEARDEKGFPWLPELVDRLMDDYVRPGRVRFLLQANVSAPQYNPLSAAVLDKLKSYSPEQVELFGLDAPLSPDDYYALVSRADVVLLPYDRNRYRACSSGTLAEAIAGGRPVVVPASSWMSSQIPLGSGETFHDFDSFVEAVKRLAENYEAYRGKAQAHRAEWVAHHAPDRLVAVLTGEEPRVFSADLKTAA